MKLSRSHDDEEDLSSFWLITYSDMVTLLLAFFLLMFSFTLLEEPQSEALVRALNDAPSGQVEAPPAPATERLEDTASRIADQLDAIGANEEAWVESSEGEVTIGLPAGITFATGAAALAPEAEEALGRVANILKPLPNAVRVEGHTDDRPMRGGAFPTNWHLSVARAQSVVKLLLARGIDPRRLQVLGYGENRPRRANDSDEGRQANRRIELKLVRMPKP